MSQQGHRTPPLSENAYTYNGKELNTDFGIALHDYGARQYDAANGRWTGIDPMAEKYAAWSPYNYVLGNPTNAIDPNGDSVIIVLNFSAIGSDGNQILQTDKYHYGQAANGSYGFLDNKGNLYEGKNEFIAQVTTALGSLREGGEVGRALVDNLMTHENNTQIVENKQNSAGMEAGAFVNWNPNSTIGAVNQTGSTVRPSYIALGHELAHIQDIWQGTINRGTWKKVPTEKGTTDIPYAEIYATHIENKLRAENGLSLRVSYATGQDNSVDEPTRILKRNTNQSLYYDSAGSTNYKRLSNKQTPFSYDTKK